MHFSVFTELSLIIALAAGVAMIMRIIHQPLIIGHILTGILVGPSVLHLIQSPETIETFSTIGIALLLFIIGLGLNPGIIREVGKVASFAGLAQAFTAGLLGWSVATLLGHTGAEAVFFGVALAFSSTIIILKLLSDKKEQNRLYGKIATGMLIVEDILATIALLFVTSQGEGNFSIGSLGLLFIKGSLIAIPLLIIGNKVLPRLHRFIAGSQEFLFLFALGWGFGTAALFEFVGFSLEVGALIAGISLASLPYTQEISSRLRPLRDFFLVAFFISLGTRLNLGSISEFMPLIIAGILIATLFKPFVVLISIGLLGYTKHTSFKAAISMSQMSEFSLIFVILGMTRGHVSEEFVAALTVIALVSIAISTYLIMYSEKLYTLFERNLSLFEHRKPHSDQESHSKTRPYELVLFGYNKGGHEFIRVFESLKKRFVVIDYDPDAIEVLERRKLHYLYGDATDIELLDEAGIEKAKLVVSVITDHQTNKFLVQMLEQTNPHAVVILHAESLEEAAELYEMGASYVVIPHYIGNEKIGAFIRKSGLKKSEFKRYREKHLAHLKSSFPAHSDEK
jgi:Kef-type K+ transport system membrane component KefB